MAHLIDKDALVAEIIRRRKAIPKNENDKRLQAVYGNEAFVLTELLDFIDDLEVKEVDLESNDAMNTEVDDSNISCNCTSCSVHTDCKYFNSEKESNVKHCFGGVPMQLKQRKESMVKEVDLENNLKGFQGYYAHENGGELPSAIDIAKHFFELGLKAKG